LSVPGYSCKAWQGTSREEEPPNFVGNRWQVPLGYPHVAALFSSSGCQEELIARESWWLDSCWGFQLRA